MSARRVLGVIGGSGLYELDGLANVRHEKVMTPFGAPSDALVVGDLGEVRLVFVPRHGRDHQLSPSEVPYAANLHALKQLGAEFVLSVSAVGSLREEIHPGHVVLPDQLIDRTRSRRSSFFGDGAVGHISFADPFCESFRHLVLHAAEGAEAKVHPSGTLVVMEGPAFSTRAESHLYRSWNAHIIGMTALPEAKLAREAELCYATVALCTDYDCWRQDEEAVTVDTVVAVLKRNVELARNIVRKTAERVAHAKPRTCPCTRATDYAVMTKNLGKEAAERLYLILGRHLPPPAQ
ncbi:MAG TPA: S-methyl-5'-thioadenosine phosphorylase [Pseudomonadota bacterium]|nr:S-methyl-5'-thioadenosine phosphorylase [Pseudomonadota bacterium]